MFLKTFEMPLFHEINEDIVVEKMAQNEHCYQASDESNSQKQNVYDIGGIPWFWTRYSGRYILLDQYRFQKYNFPSG